MAFPSFFEKPKGFLLRLAVLNLLRERSMHGYEILKCIEEDTGGRWIPSHSMLYKTLGFLEDSGFVSGKKEYKGEVERTVYKITKMGRDHVEESLKNMSRLFFRMVTSGPEMPFPAPKILMEKLSEDERKEVLLRLQDQLKKYLEKIEELLAQT